MPNRRRKRRAKWLGSVKPQRAATSMTGTCRQPRIDSSSRARVQPRPHQLFDEGRAGGRESVMKGTHRDAVPGSHRCRGELRVREAVAHRAQQPLPQLLAAGRLPRLRAERQLQERRDVIGNLAARQRQAVAGVDSQARHRRAQSPAPARARKMPRREMVRRAHPTLEPVFGELQHTRAGRHRTLDFVGSSAVEENTLPGTERREAPGLSYLNPPGAKLHQQNNRVAHGRPSPACGAPAGHRRTASSRSPGRAPSGPAVHESARAPESRFELQEAVAHRVHPIGEAPGPRPRRSTSGEPGRIGVDPPWCCRMGWFCPNAASSHARSATAGGGALALSVHTRCALIWVAAVARALRLQYNQKGCHAHESEAT